MKKSGSGKRRLKKTRSTKVERRNNHSRLIDIPEKQDTSNWQSRTLDQIRKLIQKAAPDIIEEVKWRKPSNPGGVPVWSLGGIICTGETYKDKVKLTFAKGAKLDDPGRLFNASLEGNARRAIDIHEGDKIDAKAFKALVRAAVALNTSKSAGQGEKKRAQPARATARARSRTPIDEKILAYNAAQSAGDRPICDLLSKTIHQHLPGAENKIWHAHPVWFLDGNPIVGYSRLKDCIRLMFWSGQSFEEPGLKPEGSFKAAEARYTAVTQISTKDLKRWLKKSIGIQWDYKNIVKRKGRLERLK